MNPFTLEGKRILVTGASSGIGRATAVMVSEMGATAYLVSRRQEQLEETRRLMKDPDRHRAITCDVSDWTKIPQLVADIAKDGKLDGLAHSAGIGPATPLRTVTFEDVQHVNAVNFGSYVGLVKECTKRKNSNDGFSAVAVSSLAALVGTAGQTAYAGSKGALAAVTRTLAIELVPRKIRVNSVCPSNIRTQMFDDVAADMNGDEGMERLLWKQPFGFGTPEQVASAICFLLSDAASFITGVNLPVDGGYLAQ